MADEWYKLPDGSSIRIPTDASQDELDEIFGGLASQFPDEFGYAYGLGGESKTVGEGNIFGSLYQGLENIPRA